MRFAGHSQNSWLKERFKRDSLRGGENGFRELNAGGRIGKLREHVTRDLERLLYL